MTGELVKLVRWETFRLVRRVSVLVLLGLASLLAAAVIAVVVAQNQGVFPMPGELDYIGTAAGALGVIAPLLAVVLAGFIHGADLQGGNCRTLAGRGTPRATILAAKALTCSLALLVYHLVVLGLALLVAVVFSPHFQGWSEGLAGVGAAYLTSLLYLALGILLAHWRQSVAFTVGVGTAFIFVERIAYPIAGELGRFLDWPLAEITAWTIWGVANGLEGGSDLLAGPWFIPIIAAYICGLLAAANLLFHKYDLRAGGE